jgi:hypothetical protein
MRSHSGDPVKQVFHGCKLNGNHRSIFDNGFSMKHASPNGALGKGIYFANDVDYSDRGFVYQAGYVSTILLCRVILARGKHKIQNNIQAIYDEKLCLPEYIIYYEK